MHKTLFAIAAIIASGGYFVQSLGSAHAIPTGPSVEMGEQPWLSFSGEVGSGHIDLLTVPTDRVFIMTTLSTHEYVNAFEGDTVKVEGHSFVASSSKALGIGRGHVVFAPGSTIRIRNVHTSSNYGYYVDGYFARP